MKLTDICNTLRIPNAKFVGEFKGQPLMVAENEWHNSNIKSICPNSFSHILAGGARISFTSWTTRPTQSDAGAFLERTQESFEGKIIIVAKIIFEGIKDKVKLA